MSIMISTAKDEEKTCIRKAFDQIKEKSKKVIFDEHKKLTKIFTKKKYW